MSEKRIIFQDKSFAFEGLFDMKGLFRTIIKWFDDHGYDMFENKNYEEIYENDKKIIFELIPYRKVTDYHKLEIRLFCVCEHLKEVEVQLNGVKQKLLKGGVFITFDAILVTDYENRWETKPQYYFIRALIDKFIYKSYTREYEDQLKKHVQEVEEEIKAYLNMFRYTV
jgi:hypothetical protein